MSIISWNDPFSDFEKLFGEGISGVALKTFTPAVDIYQTKDMINIEVPLPGIDPDDVSIKVENDILIISGITEKKTEVEEKDYFRHEVRKGSFYRSVPLPTHVNGDKADATYDNGLLMISIPKLAEPMSKIIKIKKAKKQINNK